MAAFTYHKKTETMSCICGEEIWGAHTCDNIKVEKCNEENCKICQDYEENKLFEAQWYKDCDGYSCCSTCGEKSNDYLPKHCSCMCYIDWDGVEKCKRCDHVWEQDSEFQDCDHCD